MRYGYFPGCSNHSSSRDYEQSVQAVARALGIELVELKDWNCCGTTGVSSVSPLFSVALSARNLALAEAQGWPDLVVTCNSCFGTLRRAVTYYQGNHLARQKIEKLMDAIGKQFTGRVRVRHLLDILVNDVGVEAIRQQVVKKLEGLAVAPYYGCLLGRPRNEFEDPEFPQSMDRVLEAVGATVVPFEHKAKCCGGALMTTKEEVALRLVNDILAEATGRGAQVVAVCCPMCQLNLDAYQSKVNQRYHTTYALPVLFFTQLVGLALGLSKKQVALGKGFAPADKAINF